MASGSRSFFVYSVPPRPLVKGRQNVTTKTKLAQELDKMGELPYIFGSPPHHPVLCTTSSYTSFMRAGSTELTDFSGEVAEREPCRSSPFQRHLCS